MPETPDSAPADSAQARSKPADSTAPGSRDRDTSTQPVQSMPRATGQDLPKEEPELRQEPSIPSDGKDEEGERLMEKLGRERKAREDAA